MIDFDIPKVRRRDTVEYQLKLGDRTFVIETKCASIETPEARNYLFTRVAKTLASDATPAERDTVNLEDMLQTVARCMVSWNVTANGADVECTPENALEFLATARATFPDEVRAFLYHATNPANFREPIADAETVGKK